MTRLIDADALLEAVKVIGNRPLPDVRTLKELELAIVNTYHAILNKITNAPTVEQEGWGIERLEEMRQQYVMNPELHATKQAYINALEYELQAALSSAPKE